MPENFWCYVLMVIPSSAMTFLSPSSFSGPIQYKRSNASSVALSAKHSGVGYTSIILLPIVSKPLSFRKLRKNAFFIRTIVAASLLATACATKAIGFSAACLDTIVFALRFDIPFLTRQSLKYADSIVFTISSVYWTAPLLSLSLNSAISISSLSFSSCATLTEL